MTTTLRLLALLLPLTLGACAVLPPEDRRPEPVEPAEAPEPEEEAPVAEPEREREPERARIPDAVLELVADARQAADAGEYDLAAAYLERAVRISPNLAPLWQNLAVVRFQQGDYAQAEQMARRSIRLAEGDRALQQRNWRIIEASRIEQGDEEGAQEARRQAEAI